MTNSPNLSKYIPKCKCLLHSVKTCTGKAFWSHTEATNEATNHSTCNIYWMPWNSF